MTTMMDMGRFETRLHVVLAENRLSQRKLADAAGLRPATVSQVASSTEKSVHLKTLLSILDALKKLTGKTYTLDDIVQYIPDGE